MLNIQGGSSSLQKLAGYFIFIFLCLGVCTSFLPAVSAEQAADDTGHTPWMFHADPGHSGINDDGGMRPANILKWSFTTGDRVYSSPAVVDDIVYAGSDDGRVYAIDAVTGAELWNYTTGGRVLASPAVINGIVYVGSYDKNLYALDKDTGTKRWSFLTGGWVTSSPVVTDGVVYSGSLDDRLYAINATTGAEIWNVSLGVYPSIDSSPAVANGVLYVSGGYNALYAINSSNGAILWNFTRDNPFYGSPAVANGIVYAGCYDKNLYAINALTGELIWNFTTGENVDSCPAVVNNIVYFGSGDNNVYALDASNGMKIWNYTTGSVVYSSPAVTTGLVFFGSFDGNVYAVGSAPPPPVADFMANMTSGFTPLTVQFTDSSTGIPLLLYQWNFGDGTPNETIQNPVHTYSIEGTYTVTLTVSNSGGTSTLGKPGYITAMEVPIDGGGKGYYLVHSNAEGADVYFNNDWYEGKIENGTLLVRTCLTCTPIWTYTVKKCGYFPLTQNNTRYPHENETIDLYANLTPPKEPLITDFDSNITTGPAPLTVGFTRHSIGIAEAWNWSFGDGTYSEECAPVHTYTTDGIYTVSLSESNGACQNSTRVRPNYITVGSKPPFQADFAVLPAYGSAPLTVKCIDKSTGKPSMIAYDFGDGGTAMGPNAAHTYRLPGVYTITQTITKYNATTNSIISSVATKPDAITVFRGYPLPPIAGFTASPVTGIAPLTVSFTDTSLANPVLYNYDFGDGVNSTSKNPVHIYRYPGTYNVTLTIIERNPGMGEIMSDSSVRTGLIVVSSP